MNRTAVFIDAGYLFAQGSKLLSGTTQRRECCQLNITTLVQELTSFAETRSKGALLRIYWYDAVLHGRPTKEQMQLADTENIKLRLGQINPAGQQKGVDALIVTDLVELARNRAISDAVIMSGDEDIRIGLVLAQQFGIRVHLIGIEKSSESQSRLLRQEADTLTEWQLPDINKVLSVDTTPDSLPAGKDDVLIASLLEYANSLAQTDKDHILEIYKTQKSIPKEHDKILLKVGRKHYSQETLEQAERKIIREKFIQLLEQDA